MSENRAESEYSRQYFGFSPEVFHRDFSELALDEMSGIVTKCITELGSPECTMNFKEEFRQKVVEMHDEWCEEAKVVLKKLEPTVKSLFTIPQNVLLETDSMCKTTYTEEEVEILKAEVAELEKVYAKQVQDESVMERMLHMLNYFEPFVVEVDKAVAVLEPIRSTLMEVKDLNKVAESYLETRNTLFHDDSDSNDDEAESISIHKSEFKCTED